MNKFVRVNDYLQAFFQTRGMVLMMLLTTYGTNANTYTDTNGIFFSDRAPLLHQGDTAMIARLLTEGFSMLKKMPKEAIALLQQANELAIDNSPEKAKALRGIGYSYLQLGEYHKALKNSIAAVKMAKEIRQESEVIKGYNNIGEIYSHLGKYPEAIQQFNRILQEVNIDSVNDVQNAYINLGLNYKQLGEYEKSFAFYHKALVLVTQKHDLYAQGTLDNNLGNLLLEKKEHWKAGSYFQKALKIGKQLDSPTIISNALLGQGKLLIGDKEFNQAEEKVREALLVAELAGLKGLRQDGLSQLYRIFKEKGSYAEALLAFEEYTELEKSIFNKSHLQEIEYLKASFNHLEQQEENALLKKFTEDQQATIERKDFQLILFSISALFFVMILFLLFLYSRSKLKANRSLRKMNIQIINQKKEIEKQAEHLMTTHEELNSVKENLECMVAERTKKIKEQHQKIVSYSFFNGHRLRAPLARILGLIYLMKDPTDLEDAKELANRLQEEGEALDTIVTSINRMLEAEEELPETKFLTSEK